MCQSSNPNSSFAEGTAESGASEDNDSYVESDDDSILFARTKKTPNNTKSMQNESWTSNTSENLEKNKPIQILNGYPTFGNLVRWRDEPPLPQKYAYPIEMPSSEIQMHLIDLFFKTKYKVAPMIPKRLFYEQLRTKGPVITPLLLNSIYCIVSGLSTLPDVPKPIVFYNRAKRLLDDFLDTPRVSTVAALCLLALYEPLPAKSKQSMSDQHCRSWMYSGMAFRMCLELGLNLDTPHTHSNISLEGAEFCRRVFWSCYCLDKMQSTEWERLWSINSSLVRTSLPQCLPGDDEEEQWIIMVYKQKIRLAIIGEEGLQIRASFSIRQDVPDSRLFEQVEQYRQKIFQWRANLESPELWGLAQCDTVEQVINEPKKSSIISYLNTVYYFMLVETFFCVPKSFHRKSLDQRIYASLLTKSVDVLCDDPCLVIRYEFLSHAIICAIRVHSLYLNDPDPEISRQSWGFFNQCVRILRNIQKQAVIPECSAVLAHLPVICESSREVNHSSRSSVHSSSSTTLYTDNSQSLSDTNYDTQFSHSESTVMHSSPLQQEPYNQNRSIDPYQTDLIPTVPHYDYLDNMLDLPPYNSLAAIGTTIGVDFADRRQLWNYALQDVSEQKYDLNSTVSTPDDTGITQQPSYASSAGWASPTRVCGFTWPSSPVQQQQQQQQQNINRLSPNTLQLRSPPIVPTNHPIMNSRQDQPYHISTSSSQADLNSILSNSYPNPSMQHHNYVPQQVNRQPILPLPFAYPGMPNTIHSLSQNVYYPN